MTMTLFDNRNINYDELLEDYNNEVAEEDMAKDIYDTKFLGWVDAEIDMEWYDFLFDIKHQIGYDVPCVVLGTIGRWDGNFEIAPTRLTMWEAINKCTSKIEYLTIELNEGAIEIYASHHDGLNHYTIHALNSRGCKLVDTNKLTDKRFFKKIKI